MTAFTPIAILCDTMGTRWGRFAAALCILAGIAGGSAAGQPAAPAAASAIDDAFARFWAASTPAAAAAAADAVAATGVGFEDAWTRLRRGRPYAERVPTGIVRRSLTVDGQELFHVLNVPDGYTPARQYAVRIQLHGGVMARTDNQPLGPDTIGMLAGPEQIYVIPYAWHDAPWWSRAQLDNLRAILDEVKRTYNIDENRVVVSGVSDGGTGAYFISMRDTTPYASFLPLNGFLLVLANEELGVDGDLAPNNLRNKPLFIVNGGQDPLYPTSVVDPYVRHLEQGGVPLDYRPQPAGGHDLRWWPQVRDEFEAFVEAHPRRPLPDTLTLESSDDEPTGRRAHWLVIDRYGAQPDDPADLADLNLFSPGPVKDFGLRTLGPRVTQVVAGSNAAALGFQSTDYIVRMNDRTVPMGTEIPDLLATVEPGSPIQFMVARRNLPVELTGTFAPAEVVPPPAPVFAHRHPTGRVDLTRDGNTVTVRARGVAAFTLLLSPDQFDFARPVKVIANGRVVFDGAVQRSVATLLKWAARDNDRTMLFGAELQISLAH